jgi:hypothetical protein
VLFGKHAGDVYDLCAGESQARVKLGKLREDVSGQRELQRVRLDEHQRLLEGR